MSLFLTAFVLLLTIAWLHWLEKVRSMANYSGSQPYPPHGPRCVRLRLRRYASVPTEDDGCATGPCGCQALRTIEAA